MTASIQIEVHADKLKAALAGAPEKFARAMSDVLLKAGIAHENVIKRNRFVPYSGRNAGDRLQRRTGALANAYELRRPEPGKLEMSSGIRGGMRGSQYAKLQEFGGTIKPKSGEYLTVPTDEALTASGALSGRFRIRKAGDGYTTDAGRTFIFKSKAGNLLIGIEGQEMGRGKNKRPRAFYVLKRSVKVPARFGFFDSWKTIEKGMIPKLIDQETRRALGG